MTEKLAYTSADVARLTGFSVPTVIALFEKEPGVLVLERPAKMNKRRYRSIRIPHGVYLRVVRKMAL